MCEVHEVLQSRRVTLWFSNCRFPTPFPLNLAVTVVPTGDNTDDAMRQHSLNSKIPKNGCTFQTCNSALKNKCDTPHFSSPGSLLKRKSYHGVLRLRWISDQKLHMDENCQSLTAILRLLFLCLLLIYRGWPRQDKLWPQILLGQINTRESTNKDPSLKLPLLSSNFGLNFHRFKFILNLTTSYYSASVLHKLL